MIFGKSIENILKYKDVRLATKWDDKGNSNSARKLIASPLFKGIQTIDENICCIELKRLKNLFNKPIFIGKIQIIIIFLLKIIKSILF